MFVFSSRNITFIYVAQWILIPIAIILIKYPNESFVFNDLSVAVTALFVVIASNLCALFMKKIKVKLNRNLG